MKSLTVLNIEDKILKLYHITYFFFLQISCYFKQKKIQRFYKKIRFVFQKRLIRFVNDLRINGFCHSLVDSSVNFCPALSISTSLRFESRRWIIWEETVDVGMWFHINKSSSIHFYETLKKKNRLDPKTLKFVK